MLDMDAYERKLDKARAAARDPAEVPHRQGGHSSRYFSPEPRTWVGTFHVIQSRTRVMGWHFSPRYFAVSALIDDSQYVPCNHSDTRGSECGPTHREEQFSRAQRRFMHFSDKLVEDLTLVDTTRFELAGMLLEGFVESQQFMLERQAEVMRVMKTTPHYQ
jgi:hypothetical protein